MKKKISFQEIIKIETNNILESGQYIFIINYNLPEKSDDKTFNSILYV